ncbi:MAG: histidine phosphatase family protein [Bacteroidales bacterium]
MKTLYLVRHAKSSWKHPELLDEERPLLEKGKSRTWKVIDFLLSRKITVDLIKSSHAVRALETAKIIAHALKFPEENIIVEKQIYHADSYRLLDQFFDVSDSFESLMLVGHNPACTNLANYFLEKRIDWLPTSGVVSISFDTDKWAELINAGRKTNFVVFPKKL